MRTERGFTLIELVMVIVILGILGAIAIPRFVDLQSDALSAAKKGMSGAVKAAHAIYIADNKDFPPDPASLAAYVQAEGVASAADGVVVAIDGTNYTVPTFNDTTCVNPTTAALPEVRCVGTIP
jgi:MSHA pilin protein MshA